MTVLGDSPKIFFEERQYYLNTMVHEYDNHSVPFGIYISKYKVLPSVHLSVSGKNILMVNLNNCAIIFTSRLN